MTFDNPDFIIWPVKTKTGKKAYVLKRYKGSESVVEIPEGVTKIDHLSFGDLVEPNETIKKIIMPDTVTEVAKNAFVCKALTEIVFSKNIKNFDINFARCPSLKEITLPEETESIKNIFSSKHLEKIHVGPNIVSIDLTSIMEKGKFDFHKDRLSEMLLENPAYEIQNGILVNKAKKTALFNIDETREEIRVPDGVETISREFLNEIYTYQDSDEKNRKAVKKVVLPKSVTKIKTAAFFYCKSLTDVIYEGSSENLEVEKLAFAFCDNITDISNITCADRPKKKEKQPEFTGSQIECIFYIHRLFKQGEHLNKNKILERIRIRANDANLSSISSVGRYIDILRDRLNAPIYYDEHEKLYRYTDLTFSLDDWF